MNMMGALVYGTIFFALVGGFLTNSATAQANTNCASDCDAQLKLGEVMFLLIGTVGIGVVGGLVPPPNQWFSSH